MNLKCYPNGNTIIIHTHKTIISVMLVLIEIEYVHNSFKILRISNLDSDIHNVNVRTIISHNIYYR